MTQYCATPYVPPDEYGHRYCSCSRQCPACWIHPEYGRRCSSVIWRKAEIQGRQQSVGMECNIALCKECLCQLYYDNGWDTSEFGQEAASVVQARRAAERRAKGQGITQLALTAGRTGYYAAGITTAYAGPSSAVAVPKPPPPPRGAYHMPQLAVQHGYGAPVVPAHAVHPMTSSSPAAGAPVKYSNKKGRKRSQREQWW